MRWDAVLGWTAVAAGMLAIVVLRLIGVDLTEGQLFFEFFPAWLGVIALLLVGALLLSNSRR